MRIIPQKWSLCSRADLIVRLGSIQNSWWRVGVAILFVVVLLLVWCTGVLPLRRASGEAAQRATAIQTVAARRDAVVRELAATSRLEKNEDGYTLHPKRGAEPIDGRDNPIDAIYRAASEAGFEVQELTHDSSCGVRDQRVTEAYRLVGYGTFQSIVRFSRGIAEARISLALAKLHITPRSALSSRLELDVAACIALVSEL